MSADKRIVGRREWVGLPDIEIPAIEARVDTGARTSALHAFAMDFFEEEGRPRVCFGVHPLRGDEETEVFACANIVDERLVASSRGQEEVRPVIRTRMRIGEMTWAIDLTLTDRRTMRYRMLIGREALRGRLLVDPDAVYLLGDAPGK